MITSQIISLSLNGILCVIALIILITINRHKKSNCKSKKLNVENNMLELMLIKDIVNTRSEVMALAYYLNVHRLSAEPSLINELISKLLEAKRRYYAACETAAYCSINKLISKDASLHCKDHILAAVEYCKDDFNYVEAYKKAMPCTQLYLKEFN